MKKKKAILYIHIFLLLSRFSRLDVTCYIICNMHIGLYATNKRKRNTNMKNDENKEKGYTSATVGIYLRTMSEEICNMLYLL